MSANDKQVGGTHYQSEFQVWDLDRYWIGYHEIAAIKYVTRWQKKNGLQDLDKACHYLEKLLEDIRYYGRTNRARHVSQCSALGMVSLQFLDKNGIVNEHERRAIDKVITWENSRDIDDAYDALLVLKRSLVGEDQK